MNLKLALSLTSVSLAAVAFSATANAEGTNWYAGIQGGVVWLQASSDTTNGGAAFGGGGTVHNEDFDTGTSVGVFLGHRYSDNWSLALSYDHVSADVSYDVSYVFAAPSRFEGTADSDLVLLNAIYSTPWGDAGTRWGFTASAGLGVAFNSLNDVTEDFTVFNGVADRFLADGDETQFAARGTLGATYALDECWALHAEGSVFTLGTFSTGSSRTAPLDLITPYEIDAWGYGLSAGVVARF
ncbi:MAG: outer membrane beta-barrel protein [Micropepsaceae bacterium]